MKESHAWPTFCNEMTNKMDERRAVDVAYLCFSRTFSPVSCNILMDELLKYG